MNQSMRLGIALLGGLLLAGCNQSDLSTPQAAAKSFASSMERGDVDGAKQASVGADPKTLESMVKAVGNLKKMRDAAVSKFGNDAKELGGPSGNAWNWAEKVDNATVSENGDTATLTPKEGGSPIKLKKVGSDWKVDASEMSTQMPGGSEMFDKMATAAAQTTDEINSGKYKTAQEAQSAFGQKMMGAMLGGFTMPQTQPQ